MKNRMFILCLILLLCLAASVCAETLATGQCGENVTWALDDEGTLTISGSGPMAEYYEGTSNSYTLYSPPFWDWKNDGNTVENRRQIKKVVIQEGVTTAGGGAFRDLDGLLEIELASSVTTIGACTFSNDTAIQEITIPATITSLGDNAFDCDSSLREVSIPASVTSIGDRVFYECTSLQNINVDANNPAYKSVDGVLFTKDGTVMLSYCPGRTATSYTIPDGVQMIRPSAFSYTSAEHGISVRTEE